MAIGTPTCSTNVTAANGTSKQSNAINTSASDLMVAVAVWEDVNPATITFSDLGSTVGGWTTLTKQIGAGPNCCLGWAVASGATSNNKATVTFNTSVNFAQIVLVRVSGCDTSSPRDQQNGGTGSSTSPSAGSITTTVADEIIFVVCKAYGAVSYSNWFGGAGTELFDNADTMGIGYRIVSATGSYTGNATMGSQAWAAAEASFKIASATFAPDEASWLPYQPRRKDSNVTVYLS